MAIACNANLRGLEAFSFIDYLVKLGYNYLALQQTNLFACERNRT